MSDLNKRQRNERKRARRRHERMRHFQIPPEITHKIEKMPPEKAIPEPPISTNAISGEQGSRGADVTADAGQGMQRGVRS